MGDALQEARKAVTRANQTSLVSCCCCCCWSSSADLGLAGWLAGWPASWLPGLMAGWQARWLAGWLPPPSSFHRTPYHLTGSFIGIYIYIYICIYIHIHIYIQDIYLGWYSCLYLYARAKGRRRIWTFVVQRHCVLVKVQKDTWREAFYNCGRWSKMYRKAWTCNETFVCLQNNFIQRGIESACGWRKSKNAPNTYMYFLKIQWGRQTWKTCVLW